MTGTDKTNILFPTDFSEPAQAALDYAVAFARLVGGEVHMVHVLALGAADPVEAEAHLAEAVPAAFADVVKSKKIVRALKPELGILHAAREGGHDLIVMGTHGRTGVSHMLLGSTAERVVQLAPCEVLTVRPGASSLPADGKGRILCPVDFSDHSRVAMERAEALARRTGCDLLLAHAVGLPLYPAAFGSMPSTIPDIETELEAAATKTLETLVEQISARGISCSHLVDTGPAALRIEEMVQEHDVHLVVLCTHGLTGLGHFLLGSTAERLVRRCPCPVLTVKAKD
jgi:nucleotide-binding universal stress UspA family protein